MARVEREPVVARRRSEEVERLDTTLEEKLCISQDNISCYFRSPHNSIKGSV